MNRYDPTTGISRIFFFYICDLCSDHFFYLPIRNKWGKIKWLIFHKYSMQQQPLPRVTLVMTILDYRCKFCYVTAVRSCAVIKGHQSVFANSLAQKRDTTTCIVSSCSAHQDATNDLDFDLEATLRSRDLRTTSDLDLMRSSYTFSDAYQREDLDGTVSFAPV